MKQEAKAVIFDWGRTLFDSEAKSEFPEAKEVLEHCAGKGYKMAVVSLVTQHANSTLKERKRQIAESPLKKFFEIALVTDTDKDALFEQVVKELGLPREEIMIVDDRTVRGIRYGTRRGHPTVWLQKGKFSGELPDAETGRPDYVISELKELLGIL
ncbi:MAG: HAD hydrolase-like protein [Candidatus Doudnabacteria bacterium]|nr:HAD hydrolase-like protein [Candidatus Doudnabacteria bacterium]